MKEALKYLQDGAIVPVDMETTILLVNALKEALAQPAQEPVAWLCSPDENGLFELPTTHKACKDCFPVYTAPPQRPWVGLTAEEMYLNCPNWLSQEQCKVWIQQIEAKLKEKNT